MKRKGRIILPTDEEDAAINRGIALDEDIPELDEEWFKRARPAREVLPEIFGKEGAEELLNRGSGRPPKENPKARVTIRLDADVVEWLKNQGPGYQTRINAILREAMEHR